MKMELAHKRQKIDTSDNFDNSTKQQQILDICVSKNVTVTQKMLDTAILRFIVKNVLPFSIVDSPTFLNLIKLGIPYLVFK